MKPNHGRQSKEMERVQVLVNHSRHWIKPHLRPALTSGFSVTLAKSSLLCLSQLEQVQQDKTKNPSWQEKVTSGLKESNFNGLANTLNVNYFSQKKCEQKKKKWRQHPKGRMRCAHKRIVFSLFVVIVHGLLACSLVLRSKIPESDLKTNRKDLEQRIEGTEGKVNHWYKILPLSNYGG